MLTERQPRKKYLLLTILLSLIILALSISIVIQTNNLHKTQNTLAFTQSELATTQADLTQTRTELATTQAELQLYKDTWGSVVASGIQPPDLHSSLVRQASATNPTWAQLKDFILKDKTDEECYMSFGFYSYTCGDFARDVYNNAEQSGIRAAFVAIKFSDGWHACNAFKTTDKGLVFIDCTGLNILAPEYSYTSNCDKIVNVRLGKDYKPMSLFGSRVVWENMGTILDVQIYW